MLQHIAGRVAALGWHVVIYFEASELPELYGFFAALPTTVVVDHMGRPDVTRPVDGPEFDGHKVDFSVLVQRNAMYRDSEQKSMEDYKRSRETEHACVLQGEKQ